MTQQLGKAISILIRAQQFENELHAEAVAGCKMRNIRRLVRKRIGNDAPIYRRYGFVPY